MSTPNADNSYADFDVYRSEPLARAVAHFRLSPIALGILFFSTISLSLTLWGSFPTSDRKDILLYFENVSWSISILTILPLLLGISFKYYQDIPRLFADLLSQIGPECPNSKKRAFADSLARRFSNRFAPIAFLLISVILNYIYFFQLTDRYPRESWIIDGTLFNFLFASQNGFSAVGVYAAIIQVVLIYWLLNVAWTSYVLSSCLREYFFEFSEYISLDPLHPDRCCGLQAIGSLSMIFSSAVFLLGLYLSLKVIDKIVVQGRDLSGDIGNPVFLSCYAIMAPVLFFLPLSSAHRIMQREKDSFLLPMARSYRKLLSSLCDNPSDGDIRQAESLGTLYFKLCKRIPVWPFDVRSLQAFFGIVVVPIVPVALPFIVQLIRQLGFGVNS